MIVSLMWLFYAQKALSFSHIYIPSDYIPIFYFAQDPGGVVWVSTPSSMLTVPILLTSPSYNLRDILTISTMHLTWPVLNWAFRDYLTLKVRILLIKERARVALRPAKSRKFGSATRDIIRLRPIERLIAKRAKVEIWVGRKTHLKFENINNFLAHQLIYKKLV
jgi:hypothetical protein